MSDTYWYIQVHYVLVSVITQFRSCAKSRWDTILAIRWYKYIFVLDKYDALHGVSIVAQNNKVWLQGK